MDAENVALLAYLRDLFESGEFADATVSLVSGGVVLKRFQCHKALLARSPFFASQLRWAHVHAASPQLTPFSTVSARFAAGGPPLTSEPSTPITSATVAARGVVPSTPHANATEFELDLESPADDVPLLAWSMTTGDASVTQRAAQPHVRAHAVEEAAKFLYGVPPKWDVPLAATLAVSSFLDVGALTQAAADHTFGGMHNSNVCEALLAVSKRDYGEAGALIESAAIAFIVRNAVDVGAIELSRLPVDALLRILTSNDIWVRTEHERARLVLSVLRAARGRLLSARIGAEMITPGPRSGLAALLRAGGSYGLSASAARTAVAAASAFRIVESFSNVANVGAASLVAATADISTVPSSFRRGGAAAEPVMAKVHRPLLEPSTSSAAFSGSGASARGGTSARNGISLNAVSTASAASGGAILSPAAVVALGDIIVGGAASANGAEPPPHELRLPAVTPTDAQPSSSLFASLIETNWRRADESDGGGGGGASAQSESEGEAHPAMTPPTSPAAAEFSDDLAELQALEDAFTPAWNACSLLHLTKLERDELRITGEVPAGLLDDADANAERIVRRLALANRLQVRRLSELTVASAAGILHSDLAPWPPVRFGLEVANMWGTANEPMSEADPHSVSTERVLALGSSWSLDVKRYIAPPVLEAGGEPAPGEFLAVYLRRRPLPLGSGSAMPDTRERTTVAFSIRLCGAPGAPTSNSVCGRSTLGKPFGLEGESSWGWETFLSSSALADRSSWTTGDNLRFLVTLDLV